KLKTSVKVVKGVTPGSACVQPFVMQVRSIVKEPNCAPVRLIESPTLSPNDVLIPAPLANVKKSWPFVKAPVTAEKTVEALAEQHPASTSKPIFPMKSMPRHRNSADP